MKLILTNRYPFPYPENISEEHGDRLSNEATEYDLTIDGVIHFQWLHTLTVEFADEGAMAEAKERTGWEVWGSDPKRFILEAKTSRQDGYDNHPAIVVRNEAWCGAILKSDVTKVTHTAYD
jgi:hypothetical protein